MRYARYWMSAGGLYVAVAAAATALSASAAWGYSSGPPNGMTGAPGEGTCQECHNSYPLNSGPGALTITALEMYEPGETYEVEVTLQQSGQSRWGFEFTPLDVGTCTVTDPANTQQEVVQGKTYVKHTTQGTYSGSPGPTSWSFEWTVPVDPPDEVTFYAAGNAANADGSPSGDHIYAVTFTAGLVPVELVGFTATPSADGVRVEWATLSEKDNAGFRVYRDTNESGEFSRLFDGLIPGAGTSSVPHAYRYVDRLVEPGRNYWYKLADVSLSGGETFHGATVAHVPGPLPAPLHIAVAPTPARDRVDIAVWVPNEGVVCLRVFDLQGRIVSELLADRTGSGTHRVVWDLRTAGEARVRPGVYVVRLQSDRVHAAARMVVSD
jgi:hypothetical protein